MIMRLEEKTGHTMICVPMKEFKQPATSTYIAVQIAMHGGRETKRTSRSIYFEINTDILNR